MQLPPLARRTVLGVAATVALTVLATTPAQAANDVLSPDAQLWTNPSSTTLEAAAELDRRRTGRRAPARLVPERHLDQRRNPERGEARRQARRGRRPRRQRRCPCSSPTTCRSAIARSTRPAVRPRPRVHGVDRRLRHRASATSDAVRHPRARRPRDHPLVHDDQRRSSSGASPPRRMPPPRHPSASSMLNHAVDAFAALPNTAVYLDGTHSAWLGVGDITDRLITAGRRPRRRVLPQRLELRDDRTPVRSSAPGSRTASTFSALNFRGGSAEWCASQYYPRIRRTSRPGR